MLLIWRGWGILAALYIMVGFVLLGMLGAQLLGDRTGFPVGALIGTLLAAAATWFTGIALNRAAPRRRIAAQLQAIRVQAKEQATSGSRPLTGDAAESLESVIERARQELERRNLDRHRLFWIPMQYFGVLYAGYGLVQLARYVFGG